MSTFEILNTLASDASRNFKIMKLQEQKDNGLLQKVIIMALNPFVNFYIRKIPKYEKAKTTFRTLDQAIDELEPLYTRKVTGHAGIAHLAGILGSVSKDDAEVLKRIIAKDLKCGVAAATVNTVWKGLVPEYPVMLATPFDEKVIARMHYPAVVQLKMDGMRFNAIVENGHVEFRSRTGKEVNLFDELKVDFLDLAKGESTVFDGELTVWRDGKMLDRKTGNGILNKGVKGTISPEEAAMVHATIWDQIPLKNFREGWFERDYYNRFRDLTLNKNWTARVKLIESVSVNSLEEAQAIYQEYLAKGEEGIILKGVRGAWEDKRVKDHIKFKAELECDLRLIGIIEGTGKYAGMVGSLQLQSEDQVINVDVGSGLSDKQRKSITEADIGKIVAINYNSRITTKEGKHSLFLPIFIEIRNDKTIADTSEEVK